MIIAIELPYLELEIDQTPAQDDCILMWLEYSFDFSVMSVGLHLTWTSTLFARNPYGFN